MSMKLVPMEMQNKIEPVWERTFPLLMRMETNSTIPAEMYMSMPTTSLREATFTSIGRMDRSAGMDPTVV